MAESPYIWIGPQITTSEEAAYPLHFQGLRPSWATNVVCDADDLPDYRQAVGDFGPRATVALGFDMPAGTEPGVYTVELSDRDYPEQRATLQIRWDGRRCTVLPESVGEFNTFHEAWWCRPRPDS